MLFQVRKGSVCNPLALIIGEGVGINLRLCAVKAIEFSARCWQQKELGERVVGRQLPEKLTFELRPVTAGNDSDRPNIE